MRRTPFPAVATALVAAVLVASMLLVACGRSASDVATPSTTEAPSTSSSSSTSTTIVTSNLPPRTDDELAAMLVGADALPGRWMQAASDTPANGGSSSQSCTAATQGVTAGTPSGKRLLGSSTGEVLVEMINEFGDRVSSTFSIIETNLNSCTESRIVNGGMSLKGTIAPMPFATYGDQSAAWRTTFDLGAQTIDQETFAIRYGTVIVMAVLTSSLPPDVARTTAVLDAIDAAVRTGGAPGASGTAGGSTTA